MSHVVAVAGPPGAGKSSLIQGLAQAIGDACAIHMDSYETMTRKPIAEIAQWMQDGADVDAFAFPQLEQDLRRLRQGLTVIEPRTRREIAARKYILFETQFGRAHRATGEHIDLLIWLDTPLDVALARNVKKLASGFRREQNPAKLPDRLQWLDGYLDNYLQTVRSLMPMQRQKVAAGADIVIDGGGTLAELIPSAAREILRRLP
jgi:uridine kinase